MTIPFQTLTVFKVFEGHAKDETKNTDNLGGQNLMNNLWYWKIINTTSCRTIIWRYYHRIYIQCNIQHALDG